MAGLVSMLPAVPVLLAHLAGVVAAIVLLVRQDEKRIPAVLALVGFGLLLLLDFAKFARGPLVRLLSHRSVVGAHLAISGVGCCYSTFEMAGIVCLIVAIGLASRDGQATSGAELKGTARGP